MSATRIPQHAEFAVRSRRVVLPGTAGNPADPVPATLWIRAGKIYRVLRELESAPPEKIPLFDFGENAILPGIVDTHAHINEPGRTEWEGFATATRAAAAGGITTVIDMPLNSIPPTTTLTALRAKSAAAEGACAVDIGFWGGVIPGNTTELEPMIDAGIFGFKAFLCPSGVDEFPMVQERDLRQAMPILAHAGLPLLVHAELESPVRSLAGASPRDYETYLRSRPPQWEVDAIRLMIGLARETGCRTHIVHLSAAGALADIARARKEGIPITVETCPHYLAFFAEGVPEGATQFKCAPPIREKANRENLWEALREGEIDFIVSDHSPCTPALKCLEAGDFGRAWGGIAGLQFSLPSVWAEMQDRGFSLADLSRLMSANTARFAGLAGRKGSLAEGADADFIVFDPDAAFTPDESQVFHRHALTPHCGREIRGKVELTFVRGIRVFDTGTFEAKPSGHCLFRPRSEKGKS